MLPVMGRCAKLEVLGMLLFASIRFATSLTGIPLGTAAQLRIV